MITKKLHKQQRGALYVSLLWAAIGAFLIYLCVQIWINGLETESKGGFGLKHLLSSFIYYLSDKEGEIIAKCVITALFAVAFIYLLVKFFKSLYGILPQNTQLGKSIYRQMPSNADFNSFCRQIDNDMQGGFKDFGGTVFASSSWIFEEEAMCLKNVKEVYDDISSGGKTVILKDADGVSLEFKFIFQQFAVELTEYLRKYLPAAKFISDNVEETEEEVIPEVGIMRSWHVQKTPEEVQNYKELAEKGDAYAQTEYGKCFLFGKGGVTPDGGIAYQWFEKAAAQSNEIAKMYVGHCVLYGIGVKKREVKGWQMLDAALNYNYPEESSSQPLAEYSEFTNEDLVQLFWDLGDALEKSIGVITNYNIAVYYFNMIDAWGHPEGGERMSHYRQKGQEWIKID